MILCNNKLLLLSKCCTILEYFWPGSKFTFILQQKSKLSVHMATLLNSQTRQTTHNSVDKVDESGAAAAERTLNWALVRQVNEAAG